MEIKVLIDLTSNKKTQDTLQNEIKDISGIQSVEFSSKDKELDQLVKSFGDSGKYENARSGKPAEQRVYRQNDRSA